MDRLNRHALGNAETFANALPTVGSSDIVSDFRVESAGIGSYGTVRGATGRWFRQRRIYGRESVVRDVIRATVAGDAVPRGRPLPWRMR
jgi:hypothetical protein